MPSARIVIDGRTIGSSSGRYVAKLVDYLGRLKTPGQHYLLLVRPTDLALARPLARANVELVAADIADFSLAEQTRLPRLLRRLQPDLVHFCFPQHPLFWRGPFILTIHDLTMLRFGRPGPVEAIKRQVFRQIIIRGLKAAEHIIVPTNYTRQDLIDSLGGKPDKIETIYDAADNLSNQTKPIASLAGRQFLLSVSNGAVHKNNHRLAAAHQQLLARHPKLHLALIGRITPELQAAAKDAKQVVITGRVSDPELVWAYRQAEALVIASLSEGFGLPGVEAWQFDLPVLGSRATCLPEVYGSAAGYFDPNRVESITSAVDRLLTDNVWRKKLITAGRKRRRDFSWEQTARQTAAVYRRAVGH